MKTHTPGPWKASPFSSVVGCPVMAQPDPKENSVLVASTYNEADARLVASAPELLTELAASTEALRACWNALTGVSAFMPGAAGALHERLLASESVLKKAGS